MNIYELDLYLQELLNIPVFEGIDVSKNGLQVACSKKTIKKIAYAVDACMENFIKAIQLEADVIFVHHGLFWGKELLVKDIHYDRLSYLIKNDLALYAVHLPLDAHPLYGNNAGLVKNLQLKDVLPFGNYKNFQLGLKGKIFSSDLSESGVSIDELVSRLFNKGEKANTVLPFGPKKIQTVGIISGSASNYLEEAVLQKLDCFITGELKHEIYHKALESKINVIGGGHYQTETFGVKSVMEKLKQDKNIEGFFIDTPTDL